MTELELMINDLEKELSIVVTLVNRFNGLVKPFEVHKHYMLFQTSEKSFEIFTYNLERIAYYIPDIKNQIKKRLPLSELVVTSDNPKSILSYNESGLKIPVLKNHDVDLPVNVSYCWGKDFTGTLEKDINVWYSREKDDVILEIFGIGYTFKEITEQEDILIKIIKMYYDVEFKFDTLVQLMTNLSLERFNYGSGIYDSPVELEGASAALGIKLLFKELDEILSLIKD